VSEVQAMKSAIQRGFTLLELMITVAIVGIVATIALWDSSDTLESNRAETYLLDLQRMISFARAKAVSTDTIVTVCRGWENRITQNRVSDCQPLPNENNAEQVIFMFSNDVARFPQNALQQFEPNLGDVVFRMIAPAKANDRLAYDGGDNIIFDTSGRITEDVGIFVYCPNPNNNDNNKALQVSRSGTALYLGDTDLTCG